jgi:putative N6-adenine-specific DNA methylase
MLEKRLKRHVIGPEQEFFVVTAPALEHLCYRELMRVPLSCKEAYIVHGGVAFKGRLHECYVANLKLATANRILMRVAHFRAHTFHKLQKKIARIPWELYLTADCELSFRISSHQSRLYHKEAVAECFAKVLRERLDTYGAMSAEADATPSKQQIFVRIVDNQFTVSLDSSGELLHKRGLKNYRAVAPVRETIAAAILQLAGYSETEPLIDPLCGSGTFSLEAAMMVKHIPSGWFREFAFMGWPGFSRRRWQHLRKTCGAEIRAMDKPQIFASDSDETMCGLLRKTVEKHNLADAVQVACKDFFQIAPRNLTAERGLVLLNPPFGLRLRGEFNHRDFLEAVYGHLQRFYSGWRLALMIPEKQCKTKAPFPGLTKYTLLHGGLKVALLTGTIP